MGHSLERLPSSRIHFLDSPRGHARGRARVGSSSLPGPALVLVREKGCLSRAKGTQLEKSLRLLIVGQILTLQVLRRLLQYPTPAI